MYIPTALRGVEGRRRGLVWVAMSLQEEGGNERDGGKSCGCMVCGLAVLPIPADDGTLVGVDEAVIVKSLSW